MSNKDLVKQLIKDTNEVCDDVSHEELGLQHYEFKLEVFRALVKLTAARGNE